MGEGLRMESYNVMISRFDTKLFISGERKTLYVKIKLHIKRSEKYYSTSVVIEDETILSKLKDWMTSHSASIFIYSGHLLWLTDVYCS